MPAGLKSPLLLLLFVLLVGVDDVVWFPVGPHFLRRRRLCCGGAAACGLVWWWVLPGLRRTSIFELPCVDVLRSRGFTRIRFGFDMSGRQKFSWPKFVSVFDQCDFCGGPASGGEGGDSLAFPLPSGRVATREPCADCHPIWKPLSDSLMKAHRRNQKVRRRQAA